MNNMQLLTTTLYKSIVAINFYLPRGKNNHQQQQNSTFIGMTAWLAQSKVKKTFHGHLIGMYFIFIISCQLNFS